MRTFFPNNFSISFRLKRFTGTSRSCIYFRSCSSSPNLIRVRFAPSPTGNLHLGGLRTALLNFLFARKNNGAFILRIEDTDRKRIKPGSAENLQEILHWAGISPDEGPDVGGPKGPYIQSDRVHIYKEKAEDLIKVGAAYRCFCSETRLELLRKEAMKNRQNPGYDNKCRDLSQSEVDENLRKGQPYTIRFRIKKEPVDFDDLVFGSHTFDISEYEGDFIIIKSDGFPTYHFSCVVDDHCMEISHILRGAEWLTSTAKHLMLHKAFDWKPPVFAHLPLLVNNDRTKLSKRQLSLGVDHFKDKGYEPLALLNFLVGIGTPLHEGLHVLEIEELVEKFDMSAISTTSCVLDLQKLDAYNNIYLAKQLASKISSDTLVDKFRSMLAKELGEKNDFDGETLSDEYIKKILHCYKGRISRLSELIQPDMKYLWTSPDVASICSDLQKSQISVKYAVEELTRITKRLKDVPESEFHLESLKDILNNCIGHEKEKYASTMKMLRIVLTGLKNGPSVAEILSMLGPDRSLLKLERASKFLAEMNVGDRNELHSVHNS